MKTTILIDTVTMIFIAYLIYSGNGSAWEYFFLAILFITNIAKWITTPKRKD